MGAWNESIYGNDSAMDFIEDIRKLSETAYSVLDIDRMLNLVTEDTEERLVLADFEMEMFNKVINLEETLNAIEDAKLHIGEWNEECKLKRLRVLSDFKKKVLDSQNNEIKEVGYFEQDEKIEAFLNEKGSCDIFNPMVLSEIFQEDSNTK